MVRDTRTGECHKQNTAREKIQLDVVIAILHKTIRFFREFKENGFEKSLVDARELAEELEMSPDERFLQTHLLVVNECENSLIMKLRMSRLT